MSTVFACLITGLLHRDLRSQDYRLLHDLIWHLVQSLPCLSKESRFCANNFTRLCSYVYFYSSITVIHLEFTSMLLFLTERTTAIRRGTRHTLLGSIGSSFRCMNYTNNPLRYYTLLLSSQLHQASICIKRHEPTPRSLATSACPTIKVLFVTKAPLYQLIQGLTYTPQLPLAIAAT